ncbi:type II toxin-antitoxin system HicA family toxin [Sphaerimonospora cavernae]|uniref:Type II toxin-antitoxin system HicA family toxin n=1 Tax=Sphaerimonospora cavernae TaxID=1740611 RepID=A0ABV6U561_9ACTN
MSKTLRLTATIVPDEEGWYVARCLQVEVTSQGRTVDEALSKSPRSLGALSRGRGYSRGPAATDRRADRDPALRVSPRQFPVCSGAQVVRALEKCGFEVVSARGSHCKLRQRLDEEALTVIVPLHATLAVGTLASIVRQAGPQSVSATCSDHVAPTATSLPARS